MRLPMTFSLYIGRQYLLSVITVLLCLTLIAGLFDTIELIRRASSHEGIPFSAILEMAFFKLPSMGQKLVGFAGLFGGMLALTRLTKTHELIVARAAGVSVWQFLTPAMLSMLLFGSIFVTVYNPISASMLSRFEKLEVKYISGQASLLAVSSSGLWLRQVESGNSGEKEHIIHAIRVSDQGMQLSQVTIFSFDEKAHFLQRIDAESASLEDGHWRVHDALITTPGEPAVRHKEYVLETELTVSQIQDSFADAKTLSFWALPGFIRSLEVAGFSALRHKLHWHTTLAIPIMLCAMVLLAAVFSLRLPRRGGVKLIVGAGVFTGFCLFFVSDIIFSLGLSGALPVELAAWIPTITILLVGGALLLHLEDG